jgi:Protein of unknown function DUF262
MKVLENRAQIMSMTVEGEIELTDELRKQRRTVDFDTFDFALRQIVSMLDDKTIDVAPVYQRQFRWDDVRCSQLVESVFLGIPVPSLFMATNANSTWELVDGVQRVSAIVRFMGSQELRERMGLNGQLRLIGLEKLAAFNGKTFSELPPAIRQQLELRPLKIITLSDKSDQVVRYDLFERLNRGGISLTPQEIRDCVFRGPFSDLLDELVTDPNFEMLVRLPKGKQKDGIKKECVLRFFAFLYGYREFVHEVEPFLTGFMEDAS